MPGIGGKGSAAAGMVVNPAPVGDVWIKQAHYERPYRIKSVPSRETNGRGWHAEATLNVMRAAVPKPAPRQLMGIELKNPVSDRLRDYAYANRAIAGAAPEVVQRNAFLGETLALCGAGPSLDPKLIRGINKIWACNSALPWLMQQGVPVDTGVGIDQSPGLLREWSDPPEVTYYLASTVDPELTRYLQERGRRIVWFHNYVAWAETADEEFGHYNNDWPEAYMLGTGATVVPRVVGLAAWLGFERIDVHGADCALGEGDVAHANGETAVEAFGPHILMGGDINGRYWRTRPDLLMAAVDLARCVQKNPGHVRLIGDTLAVALCPKPDSYLDEVVRRLKPGEIPTQGA